MADLSDWEPVAKTKQNMGDWEPVAPAAPQNREQPVTPEVNTPWYEGGMPDIPGAAREAVLNMGSSMIAKPVSDIAGLAATGKEMISPTPGGGDPEGFKSYVQNALTFEPRTQVGKNMAQYNPLALLGKAIGAGTHAANSAVGGGISGNALEEILNQASGFLGLKTGIKASGIGTKLEKVAPTSKAQAAAIEGQNSGYVIPPSQANPSILNKFITGYGVKIQTEQAASAKNQHVTNRMIKDDLGIPQDRELDGIEFSQYRKSQSKPYDEVRALPEMKIPTKNGAPSELDVKTTKGHLYPGQEVHTISGEELVRAWKKTNADAKGYYQSNKINPHPDTLEKAQAKEAEAHAIDDMISMHAKNSGKTDLHARLQEARKNIAKSHDIEAATNQTSGNVDAQALYNNLRKGKYMTGGQKDVANFAGNFKKSVQLPEKIGAQPGISPLDIAVAGIEGTGAMAAGKPGIAATALSAALGRPIARKIALSDWYQRKLAAAQQYERVKK